MEYVVLMYKDTNGLVAVVPDIDESVVYGATFEEITEALEDFLELCLEDEALPHANTPEYFTNAVLQELSIPLTSTKHIIDVVQEEEDELSYDVELRDTRVKVTGNIRYTVYLAGEIHSNWREEIVTACEHLDIKFLTPEYDHASSDDIGKNVLGTQGSDFYNDHVSAKINAIRNQTCIQQADIVVVKFGEKYKQWNAAFDAGYANALQKKLIVVHPSEYTHALKEIDAAASAVVFVESQVVKILEHLTR